METGKSPAISVIMGVLYKREKTDLLERSIKSVLNQTYPEFELLVCDDGSIEEAKRLLDAISMEDDRVRLVRPGNKIDLASKLNACLKEAKGEYIARMDDDDYSAPNRFQRQKETLDNRLDMAFVGSNVVLARNRVEFGERKLPEYPMVKDFYMTQPYVHPALMFRKTVIDAVGGYSEDKMQVLCEDYDLLLRIYAKGYQGMNIQENLLEYTVPATAKGNRKMKHRWNEAVTRFSRFKELGVLPKATPYVIKPLLVGLVPEPILWKIKCK